MDDQCPVAFLGQSLRGEQLDRLVEFIGESALALRLIEVDAKDAVDALRFFGALRREPGPQTQHLLITFGQQAHTLTSGISQGGVFLLFLVEAHVESLQFRHRV